MAKNAETLRELNGGIQTIIDEEVIEILDRVIEEKGELPSEFKEQYERLTAQIDKRSHFIKSKLEWRAKFPDFKRICDAMELFKTDRLLREFCQSYPLKSHDSRAIDIYKKCISYRTKWTNRITKNLKLHPDASAVHYHKVEYCIDPSVVRNFLTRYQTWMWIDGPQPLWNELFNLRHDFIFDSGYDRTSWISRIDHPDLLRQKADQVDELKEKLLQLLNTESNLLFVLDEYISQEYGRSPTEMSLYERELEIAQIADIEDRSDEEYCYVYTLECDLFVFYVGIAANPKERFDQHIRGAFSDEAHLFKSKFIQKFHAEVRHKIIFEGTRRECKKFERSYIEEFKPLGNMTEGGEG